MGQRLWRPFSTRVRARTPERLSQMAQSENGYGHGHTDTDTDTGTGSRQSNTHTRLCIRSSTYRREQHSTGTEPKSALHHPAERPPLPPPVLVSVLYCTYTDSRLLHCIAHTHTYTRCFCLLITVRSPPSPSRAFQGGPIPALPAVQSLACDKG